MRKIFLFFCLVFPLTATAPAYALSCVESPFDPERWQGSVFRAKTVEDTETLTKVEIVECIKSPCRMGPATIIKEYWGFGRPRTKAGESMIWAVNASENPAEYKVQVCTRPTENFWAN